MTAQRLMAGSEAVVITPPVGVDLCGYGARKGPSVGVHDDLHASALFLANGSAEMVLIACDLIGLHHDQVREIRQGIGAQTGIACENIMISCTHTHAGPATPCIHCLGEPDQTYLAWLHERITEAALAAQNKAVPAELGWGRGQVNVGMNRREVMRGQVVIGMNEGGTTQPWVDVLAVNSLAGTPLAVLYSHPAHAVALGGDNLLISADWPGAARRCLREHLGPACVPLFVQGCCGNINCRERGWEGVESQGARMADAVLEVRSRLHDVQRHPILGAAIEPLFLPLSPAPETAAARAMLADARGELARLPGETIRGVRWMAECKVAWCGELVRLAEAGDRADRGVAFDIQAMRIGGFALVGLPGEVFVEYGLNISAMSPFPVTAVAGYTNGNVGYIPTESAYVQGGYEVNDAIRYYGSTMPLPESERAILQAAQRALQSLTGGHTE